MKEQIHTIPIADAIAEAGECPFCYIEKCAEQRIIDFVLGAGASYMEADMRERTDNAGFCRRHFKKMFEYGNSLGNAWILKTHYKQINKEMNDVFKDFKVNKLSFIDKLKKHDQNKNSIVNWIDKKECSCYICTSLEETFNAYMGTFLSMYKKEPDIRAKIKESRGFCLTHFRDLCIAADERFSQKELEELYAVILPLMSKNMERLSEDVSWFVEKFDYRNKDADWKDSKDALQRGMQKLKGGYPADAPYTMKK